jgi:hypothetical protein
MSCQLFRDKKFNERSLSLINECESIIRRAESSK